MKVHKRVGDVIGNFIIIGDTGKLNKLSRRILLLKCKLCNSLIERSTNSISQAKTRGQSFKCLGCREAKFTAATLRPLSLTPEQAASALRWARSGVRSVLGNTDLDLQEDIASEALLTVLVKGASVGVDGVDKFVFRVAQTEAKRRFNKPEAYFVEPKADDDGSFQDAVDNLNVVPDSDDLDLSLQRQVFKSLPQLDQDFLLAYPTFKYSRTKAARYVELCNKVRAAMIENLEIGGLSE